MAGSKNADGSFDLVFGYFNRNWEQSLVGHSGRYADDRVEVAAIRKRKGYRQRRAWPSADRGQPTFFHAADGKAGCIAMRVPANFGKRVMRWTIKSNNKTETA